MCLLQVISNCTDPLLFLSRQGCALSVLVALALTKELMYRQVQEVSCNKYYQPLPLIIPRSANVYSLHTV